VYTVTTDDETQQQLDALPAQALAPFAELRTTLEVAPWNGAHSTGSSPTAPYVPTPFGPHSEGMTTYLILGDQRRVDLVNILWVD
jgi:hypothetical protein